MCSSECVLVGHLERLCDWFCERGYPKDLVDKQVARVKIRMGHRNNNGNNGSEKMLGVPFVVTYHPCLANLGHILCKFSYLLNSNYEMKRVFNVSPLFHSGQRALKIYLVRAKIYPLDRITGLCRCNKRSCGVVKIYVNLVALQVQ